MSNFPAPGTLMLVGILPSPVDLEIARVLGWYRIPFRTAPKVVAVDYLAFYQTGTFGEEHRWQIEYFAEVHGNELTTRAELFRDQLDHPRAHEEYFKIQIGELRALPQPILAEKWRRITFLYTTGELFRNASSIQDLVVRSDERALLWKSLRERAQIAGQDDAHSYEDLPIDPQILMMLGDLGRISEEPQDYDQD